MTGNGTNKPLGILAAPMATTTDQAGRPFGTIQYIKTGIAGGLPASTITMIDMLLSVVHSLNQRYRQGASWVMNTTTLGLLRTSKDTTGRPVLLDSMVTGQPATLLGYPVYEVDDLPDPAANAFPIVFGNFKRGYVLDEHEAGLRVIVDNVTAKPYVGFYSVRRLGGAPLDTNAIKLVKCAV
jgi:HK97 family phage major capsid protein